MPLGSILGPTSITHIKNNTDYPVYATVQMKEKISFSLTASKSSGWGITIGPKTEYITPPGFTYIAPGQTHAFCPEGSGKRILEVCTAYLSIYIKKSETEWFVACENHQFKENRSFTIHKDCHFTQDHYDEMF